MSKAGVPMVQGIDIVMEGTDKAPMKDLINRYEMMCLVAPRGALDEQARQYFDELYCSLISAGENSGTLEVMLDRIAIYKEKTEALKAKIKKALTYQLPPW